MNFIHELLEFEHLERVEIDGSRYYRTPLGDFKSVTTILGERTDHTWLEKWKNRVGEAEVQKVSGMATVRGTAVHDLCEKYLMNDTMYKRGAMPVNLYTFNKIKPLLDKNVGLIYGIEARLYSGQLKAAGTSDLIAMYDGVLSIVDFKTSKRIKSKTDIDNYFIQATAYAMMLEERKGLSPMNVAILMAVDEDDVLEFRDKVDNWRDRVLKIFY